MEFLVALLPSAGVLFLFVVGVRAVVEADRRERAAAAELARSGNGAGRGNDGGNDGEG
ncbi:MAG: hypothetical protein GXX79_17335 [Actinomycetales bacterium]|nr:hypothetical protein [Actinomycetales bacterium]